MVLVGFRIADPLVAVWSGALQIGSESKPHKPFHTLVLSAAPGENGVQLTATEENTEFVLVCIDAIHWGRTDVYAGDVGLC